MKDNNITFGCNPPANTEFCPEDNVTRGEMAAFLHRFANNVAGEDGVVGPAGPAGPQGPAGPAGPEGPAGPAGADVADGTDGADGADGTDGADGADGADGTSVNNLNFGDTYCTSVAGTPTFNCYEFVSPSSNAQNITNGWAYYSIDDYVHSHEGIHFVL